MKIVLYPDPALRRVATPVQGVDADLRRTVRRMFDLMYEAKGVGLAAPQVVLPLRLLILNPSGDPKRPEEESVHLNPAIVQRHGRVTASEGCLSFPDLFLNVPRAERVGVTSRDLDGKEIASEATGILARMWQHEVDHLDGVLFIDHVSSWRRFLIAPRLKRMEFRQRRHRVQGSEAAR